MSARAIMLQGTGSDVGKSVLTAALCRIALQQGYRVAPFKPQNMSNNAHACLDGGEIGRAQALQAQAAGLEPHVDMNPVLLKPQSDQTAQVVVHGKVLRAQSAQAYMSGRDQLLTPVLDSFSRLCSSYDLVIVEGAGSPAETNLRQRDIANMGFARAAGVPVCLIGDIDRGGVIAALAGTRMVLSKQDAGHVNGFVINKFRGDPRLFDEGITDIERFTQWPCWGVIPWLDAAGRLPAEDAVVLQRPEPDTGAQASGDRIKIAAPMLSRLANFDDVDPLIMEPRVDFTFVPPGQPLPGDADAVLLLGTKSTIADLAFLRAQGWHHDLYAHVRRGGHVLGVCGGYQMLGSEIVDEYGADGQAGRVEGLGLLAVTTLMQRDKITRPVQSTCVRTGHLVHGYEIHTGTTDGVDASRPMFSNEFGDDGAADETGRVQGCYLHGLFVDDIYRADWLAQLKSIGGQPTGGQPTDGQEGGSVLNYSQSVEQALNELAEEVARHIDVERLLSAAQPSGWQPDLL